jgi:hypothetical protein
LGCGTRKRNGWLILAAHRPEPDGFEHYDYGLGPYKLPGREDRN